MLLKKHADKTRRAPSRQQRWNLVLPRLILVLGYCTLPGSAFMLLDPREALAAHREAAIVSPLSLPRSCHLQRRKRYFVPRIRKGCGFPQREATSMQFGDQCVAWGEALHVMSEVLMELQQIVRANRTIRGKLVLSGWAEQHLFARVREP